MTRTMGVLRSRRPLTGPILWSVSLTIALLVSPSTSARADTESAATDESRAEAEAEAETDDRAHAIAQLRPGTHLRLDMAGSERLEGRFVSASTESLVLTQSDRLTGIPVAEIQSLRVRGRGHVTGATVGGILGVTAGGLFGALVAVFEEDSDSDDDLYHVFQGAWLGTLVVGTAGAGLGALLPKWNRQFPGPSRVFGHEPGWSAMAGGGTAGFGYFPEDIGPSASASALRSLTPTVFAGPELSFWSPGKEREFRMDYSTSRQVLRTENPQFFGLGLGARVRSATGRIRPFGRVGAVYARQSLEFREETYDLFGNPLSGREGREGSNHFGASFGAGVQVGQGPLSFQLDVRRHALTGARNVTALQMGLQLE
jgi:hypothetical protein